MPSQIHQDVIFGRFHAAADPKERFPAFLKGRGFEKCALSPGISARLIAEILLEDLEKKLG
jgi:hypothetical protein